MATEVPSCSMSAPDDEDISMISFINKNASEDFTPQLYQEWNNILEQLQILETMRKEMDSWFLEVYKLRDAVKTMEREELHDMLSKKENELYERFLQGISDKIDELKAKGDNFKILNLQSNLKQVQSNCSPLGWVKNAVKCVEMEVELIRKYSQSPADIEMCETEKKMDADLAECESMEKKMDEAIKSIDQKLEDFDRFNTELEKNQNILQNLELLLQSDKVNKKNGVNVCEKERQQVSITQIKDHQQTLGQDICAKLLDMQNHVHNIVDKLDAVTKSIENEIREWKKQFQFDYAQIMASPKLERISPWCEKMGILLEKVKGHFIKAEQQFDRVGDDFIKNYKPAFVRLMMILHRLYQSTFLVVEQEDFVIKVDKKNFPKISVRFLAAEGLNMGSCKVEAHFVYEDYIQLQPDGKLNVQLMKDKEKKINGNSACFRGNQKGKPKETFSGMHFKDKDFTRGETANNKMIHEQKYRIIFTTMFSNEEYWTMSLPLVVTTGANQGCRALASIMWQCYATDVYQVPIEKKDEMPWCEVAQMVNQKVRRLSPQKQLSEDNLNHLKFRMFGGQQVPDDEMVSLNKFCYDKMYDKSDDPCFTFWKWFLANYNLLEKYLLNYWENGLIEGFLSKKDCQRMFKRCGSQRDGLFILRFSDQHIDDSQGIKNIFGHLVADVSNMKETENGVKKREIFHVDVAGHSKLKNKNLANILKETLDKHQRPIYQYIYPGKRTREQAFDGYCRNGNIVEGYEGPREALIVDLEHAVCKLELGTGKHRSPSFDSGFEAASPASVCSSVRNDSKKLRSVEDSHPTLTKMLSASKPVGSPAMSDMSHLSSPQHSPAFSAASPAESRGKYMSEIPIHSESSLTFPPNLPKFEDLHNDLTGNGLARNRNNPQPQNQAGLPHYSRVQDGSPPNTTGMIYRSNEILENSPQTQIIIGQDDLITDGEDVVIYINDSALQTSTNQNLPTTSLPNQTSQMVLANQNSCNIQSQYPPENQAIDCTQQLIEYINGLPNDKQQELFQTIVLQQRVADIMSPEPVQVATDNIPEDIQAVNSSGSLFNFNASEISEADQMDSGSIDPKILDKFGEDQMF